MKLPSNRPDFFGAVLSIAIGIAVSLEAYRLRAYSISPYIGDHTFPAILGAVFLLLGTVLLIHSYRKQGGKPTLPSSFRGKMIQCLAVLFLYTLLIVISGYVIATLVASAALFRLIGQYRWPISVALACVLTGSLYIVFIKWLQISFPAGYLF